MTKDTTSAPIAIDLWDDRETVGSIQNATVNISYSLVEGFEGMKPSDELPTVRIETDLLYRYRLGPERAIEPGGPFTIVARDNDRELWRASGCVVDHPGETTKARHGDAIRGRSFSAQSFTVATDR